MQHSLWSYLALSITLCFLAYGEEPTASLVTEGEVTHGDKDPQEKKEKNNGGKSKKQKQAPKQKPAPLAIEPLEEQGNLVHAPRFLGDQVDYDRMMENLDVLTGQKRFTPRDSDQKTRLSNRYSDANREYARDFLTQKLEQYGFEWEIDRFGQGANVVATRPGTTHSNEVVEISAHYDTQGPFVTGADDNGSGVIAALEAARILGQTQHKRRINITFPDLEERGFGGSRHHVQRLSRTPDQRVVGALVLDWIGHSPRKDDFKIEFEIGAESEGNFNLANALYFQQKRYDGRKIDFFPVTDHAMPYTGDHGSYWRKDIPAVFFSQYLHETNETYHQPTDTKDTINPAYLKAITEVVVEGAAALAGAGIPAALMPEFQKKLAGYTQRFNPQLERGTNFVEEARPDWQLEQRDVAGRAKSVIASFVDLAGDNHEARAAYRARIEEIRKRGNKIQEDIAMKQLKKLAEATSSVAQAKNESEYKKAFLALATATDSVNRQWDLGQNISPGEACNELLGWLHRIRMPPAPIGRGNRSLTDD
jgi:hypothetical protein